MRPNHPMRMKHSTIRINLDLRGGGLDLQKFNGTKESNAPGGATAVAVRRLKPDDEKSSSTAHASMPSTFQMSLRG